MTRPFVLVLFMASLLLGMRAVSAPIGTDDGVQVTFNRDVLPILQENCQLCHRPGQIAPMSFMTYQSTRPWAKAIKAAVLSGQMPPWLAERGFGNFRNAPKLGSADVATLAAWVDGGAIEGNPADKPAPRQWADGWRIPPDVVVSMPISRHIPAKGEGEIVEFSVPSPFEEDTLVSSIEVLPGDPAVVHHVLVQTQTQSKFLATPNPPRCSDCIPKASGPPRGGGAYSSRPSPNVPRFTENDDIAPVRDDTFTTMEAVYAPGGAPLDLRATNSATLIPGGKPIRIEMHYTPNGKETSDQTKIGFTLATDAMSRRFVIMAPEHLGDTGKPIPANDGNWETTGELTFQKNAELAWFMPHMHLRGKDMKFQLLYPNGGLETVLDARFKFNWQLGYELEYPLEVKRGTRMIVTAHHDNSANNPANPAPDQSVGWGELTSQEMMLPWFGVIVTGDARPDQIASYKVGR